MIKTTHLVIATALVGTTAVATTLQSSEARESKSHDFKVGASGARLLKIDVPIGEIRFRTAKTNELAVHIVRSTKKPANGSTRRWMDKSKFTVERVGTELRVTDVPFGGEKEWEHTDTDSKDLQLDVEITVPESINVDYDVKYGAIKGGGKFGTFSGEIAAGSVDLRGLSCSGAVTLNAAAGEISLGLASSITRDSKLSIAAGQIEIDLPKNFNAELFAKVATGEIEGLRVPEKDRKGLQLGNSVRAKLGNGGPKLNVNVGVGNITINPGSATVANARQVKGEVGNNSFHFSGDINISSKDLEQDISKAIEEASVEMDRALAEADVEIKKAMEEVDLKEIKDVDIEAIVRSSMNLARQVTKEALRSSREGLRKARESRNSAKTGA